MCCSTMNKFIRLSNHFERKLLKNIISLQVSKKKFPSTFLTIFTEIILQYFLRIFLEREIDIKHQVTLVNWADVKEALIKILSKNF